MTDCYLRQVDDSIKVHALHKYVYVKEITFFKKVIIYENWKKWVS